MEHHKQQLLEILRNHIRYVQIKITDALEAVQLVANRSVREIAKMRPENQVVEMQLKGMAMKRVEELEQLYKTPYFIKCEAVERDTNEKRTYYFAKHHFSDEMIYSWVAPVAAIRFESPGDVSYSLPNGEKKQLTIISREQYMIVDGKVLFFAREDVGTPRQLVYQEHFTQRKTGFVLPEIVAQMEKAQDKVIRAHHIGPLVISGPAGSGKTTLALHRVAYLTQAPDTAELYDAQKCIVFVQDVGTKEYFSALLPELGIHNVTITTFALWAMQILGISDYAYVTRYGQNDEERDIYEYQKIRVLREWGSVPEYAKNPFAVLTKAYEGLSMFHAQKKEKKVDRFDLTILLKAYLQKYQKIETKHSSTAIVNGVLKRRTHKTLIQYPLIVVDEFQNYLPEQLQIFKSCVLPQTQSIMYVGDTAQQVYLGTIKEFKEIGETILPDRSITLNKVYRNTRNILSFIQTLGYTISIPEGIKVGPAVSEVIYETVDKEIAHIKKSSTSYAQGTVGILGKNEAYLQAFKVAFKDSSNVHVLTMNESQGVEFDLVCIVGIHPNTFSVAHYSDVSAEHIRERTAIQKDLLYVALTRAITELHVLGTVTLGEIVK